MSNGYLPVFTQKSQVNLETFLMAPKPHGYNLKLLFQGVVLVYS